MHETRPIINMILDTSLTLCKHKKKLKASRQLSEEIFRLHFIIFHYHCFTDAFTDASSRLWNMIISCKFWPICRWAVSANIQNINKPHLPMSVQLPEHQMAGWSAKAHFVNCQSCRDYSFSNYWTAQDVVNMRKELFFRSSSKDWRKSLQS